MASNLDEMLSLETVTRDLDAVLAQLREVDGFHSNIATTLKVVCAQIDTVIAALDSAEEQSGIGYHFAPGDKDKALLAIQSSRSEVLKVLSRIEPEFSARN